MTTDSEVVRPQRRGAPRQLLGALGAVVAIIVALIVPVIVMQLMAPRGFPTRLPDGLAFVLLAVAGAVVGIMVRLVRGRPLAACAAAALLTLLALWFQANTWWSAAWVPTPPILPNVAPTLVITAGVLLAAAAAAVSGRSRAVPRTSDDQRERTSAALAGAPPTAIALGLAAALAVVLVVEGTIRGRGVIQETFQGPWGLSLFGWLGWLFVAMLVAGMLVGWTVSTTAHGALRARVAAVVLAGAILLIWAVAGLDGPPRSTLYGLSFGILVIGAALPSPRARG